MTQPLRLMGKHVYLRDLMDEDLSDVQAVVGDPRVTHWLSFEPRDHQQAARMLSALRAAAAVTPRTEYYLGVVPLTSDRVVGFVRLAGPGPGAKLGYAMHADHWGQGWATDAARVMVDFGFGTLGLHRITAAVGPDNVRSQQLLLRLGFELEGRLREHVWTNGAWRDSLLYARLASA